MPLEWRTYSGRPSNNPPRFCLCAKIQSKYQSGCRGRAWRWTSGSPSGRRFASAISHPQCPPWRQPLRPQSLSKTVDSVVVVVVEVVSVAAARGLGSESARAAVLGLHCTWLWRHNRAHVNLSKGSNYSRGSAHCSETAAQMHSLWARCKVKHCPSLQSPQSRLTRPHRTTEPQKSLY